MISPIKVNKVIENWEPDGDFEIVENYETVDALFGLGYRVITDDDIAALKKGKRLYCNDGEYAQIISYKEEKIND